MRRADLSPERRERLVPLVSHPGAFGLIPPPPPGQGELDTRAAGRDLNAAERALEAVKTHVAALPDPALIAHILSRREAVRSSQIEGTHTEADELFTFEATRDNAGLPPDVIETFNYVKALDLGLSTIRQAGDTSAFSIALIERLHGVLLAGVDEELNTPGALRNIQNWIGGGGRIYDAKLVPPPPDRVRGCLEELMDFLRYEPEPDSFGVWSVVVRAAIAHVQFEAIHPFRDGNGRVGRLLIPLMLAADDEFPLYIAGYLKQRQRDYYDRLAGVQLRGEWLAWLTFFARGVTAAARQSIAIADGLAAIAARWREAIADLRVDAAAHRVLSILLGQPVVTATFLKEQLGVSFPTANTALAQLVARGILNEGKKQGRRRVFVAREPLALLG